MKKIVPIISFLFLITSCSKSFLNLTPPSAPTEDAFYKTAADAVTAVNACYSGLRSGYNDVFERLMEYRADNVIDLDASSSSGVNYKIAHFIEDAGNAQLYATWVNVFNNVYQCNTLLSKIDAINMDNGLKTRIKAEARFLRGLDYFNLVRLWGAVPVDTTILSLDSAYKLKRADVTTVYALIESDLNFASTNLPVSYSGTDIGRATSGAANGLLGKVYLYEKKYDKANAALQSVINANTFQLLPNIADVFSSTNKYNAEILFAVRYKSGTINQNHNYWYSASGFPTIDPSIQNAYISSDSRKTLTDAILIAGTTNNTAPRKFVDAPDASQMSGADFPVLRYADIFLMQAEVLNEISYNPSTAQGTAFYYLDSVRSRAKLPKLSATDLPDQASFRQEIYKQRRLELPFECDRWFDLVRTGQAIAAIKADTAKGNLTIQSFQFIYAIPQQEIDIMNNKTTFGQNPGY